MMRKSVDLPLPFAPITPTLSDSSRPNEMDSNSGLTPKVLLTFSSDRIFIYKELKQHKGSKVQRDEGVRQVWAFFLFVPLTLCVEKLYQCPLQQGSLFSKKAPMPSCASSAIMFRLMTSLAYS